jgi:hypothetical protein
MRIRVDEDTQFLKILIPTMQALGVGVDKKKSMLSEQEVSKERIAALKIEEIIEMVEAYEQDLQEDLTLSNIQTLLNLYQQAIEYYSAMGDSRHEQYLFRQMEFLKQPEINAVLHSH